MNKVALEVEQDTHYRAIIRAERPQPEATGADAISAAARTVADTLNLAAGSYNLKFVTDGAFDNPEDYGGDETTLAVPGTHPVELVSGIGTAISISVLSEGDYIFVLDERSLEFTATLIGGGTAEGTISGTVGFTGLNEAPFPQATVSLLVAGSTSPTSPSGSPMARDKGRSPAV